VLLITLDTTRADYLGCYGDEGAHTPNLDGFAESAVLFEQAVAPVPVTLPSHSTMLTGLNPYRHGVRYNLMYVLPDSERTVTEDLAEAGFATGAVVSAPVISERYGLAQGFEMYDDLESFTEGKSADEQPGRDAGEVVERAIEWWGAQEGRSRFLWVHLYDPHWPYDPPFPWSSRFEGRSYAGEIAYMDEQIGRLFESVRAAGDWDRTLIVVAGDHGEGLYEHGERWHADLIYQSTMHPPMIVKPPGWTRARRVAEPVALADVGPTILDYTEQAIPEGLDGISLREAVDSGVAEERAIYFESIADNLNYGWAALTGVRIGPLKYFEGARPELYDVETDPGELLDLAATEPDLVRQMAEELAVLRALDEETGEADATRVLESEQLDRLISLGYVGSSMAAPSDLENALHPPDEVDLIQELLRSQGLAAAGRWEEVGERLDFILGRDPLNRAGLYNRAFAYMAAGQNEEALLTAETLADFYPDSHRASDLVARVLSALDRPSEAADVLAAALEQHPGNPELLYHRFLALMEADRRDEARESLKALESERPDDFTTAVSRAMLEAAEGRAEEALTALDRAVELGLRNFAPTDASPIFDDVRQDPRYEALKEKAEEADAEEEASGEKVASRRFLNGRSAPGARSGCDGIVACRVSGLAVNSPRNGVTA
jgi:arylsulfatase A-like enzyme